MKREGRQREAEGERGGKKEREREGGGGRREGERETHTDTCSLLIHHRVLLFVMANKKSNFHQKQQSITS